jgi:hypothetical protein
MPKGDLVGITDSDPRVILHYGAFLLHAAYVQVS